MKALRILLMATATIVAMSAQALTLGSLSRTEGSNILVDSLNHREWLAWDINKDLSYLQTLAVIAPGGAYEGFRISERSDAMLFAGAMIGPGSTCSNLPEFLPIGVFCGVTSSMAEVLVGESFHDRDYFRRTFALDLDVDAAYFLTGGNTYSVGRLEIGSVPGQDSSVWFNQDCCTSELGASVPWLLYRDRVTAVPEPGTLMLFGLGVLALGLARGGRRTRSGE